MKTRSDGGSLCVSPMKLTAFVMVAVACGGRVSVGDLGNDSQGKTTGSAGAGGLGSVPDGTYRAAGTGPTTTGPDSAPPPYTGPTTSTGSAGAGGEGGIRDAAADRDHGSGQAQVWPDVGVPPPVDGSVPIDVHDLGGAACGGIEYPPTGFYGRNVLVPSEDWVQVNGPSDSVELVAKLAPTASLSIAYILITPLTDGGLGISSNGDFRGKALDTVDALLLEAKFPGQRNELALSFRGVGRAVIVYYECGATTPTATKMLAWQGWPN